MNIMLNYALLAIGLLIAGGLWVTFASDPEVKVRAKKYVAIFLVWGLVCYTVQYLAGWGAAL
ncbi:MAG: hypothetical protein AAGU12_16670 [Clostridiales bacterium]